MDGPQSLITLLYKWCWLSITTSYQDQQLCTIGVERALLQSIFGKAVVVAALAKNASGSSLPPTCTTLHFVHVLPYKLKVKLMSLPVMYKSLHLKIGLLQNFCLPFLQKFCIPLNFRLQLYFCVHLKICIQLNSCLQNIFSTLWICLPKPNLI